MKTTIDLADFCRRWNIAELALFGSRARGDFREDSDVDLLVRFAPSSQRRSLFDHLEMKEELCELFGREVDLVQEHLIENPFRRHNILLDKQVIYPPPEGPLFDRIRDAPHYERDVALMWDILHAAHKLMALTRQATLDDYRADETMQLACERLLTIIGEASRKLSAEFKARHADVPWQKIVGLRNVIVHDYRDLDQEELWETITIHLPVLVRATEGLLPR